MRPWFLVFILLFVTSACTLENATPTPQSGNTGGNNNSGGTLARVTRVIDGDTIDVDINGVIERVRYVGMNTPERDESCYREAVEANRALVEGQTVRLVADQTNRDRFDRLLRYIYVGDTFVNAELVRGGWAEVVLYEPDRAQFENFRALEQEATGAGRGCHPTGIFDDGTYNR